MRLWILRLPRESNYDEHDAVVIRARTESDAREIAGANMLPRGLWGSAEIRCDPLEQDGDPEIVLASFSPN